MIARADASAACAATGSGMAAASRAGSSLETTIAVPQARAAPVQMRIRFHRPASKRLIRCPPRTRKRRSRELSESPRMWRGHGPSPAEAQRARRPGGLAPCHSRTRPAAPQDQYLRGVEAGLQQPERQSAPVRIEVLTSEVLGRGRQCVHNGETSKQHHHTRNCLRGKAAQSSPSSSCSCSSCSSSCSTSLWLSEVPWEMLVDGAAFTTTV